MNKTENQHKLETVNLHLFRFVREQALMILNLMLVIKFLNVSF